MAATKLGLYNSALGLCKERALATLSDNLKPRFLLDRAWNLNGQASGMVLYCLEMSTWAFALRSSSLTYAPSITPPFGLRNAFDRPTDWVRTDKLCRDQWLKEPMEDGEVATEGAFFFSDYDTIYISYVSNDVSYGLDMSLWPTAFGDMIAKGLAARIVGDLTRSVQLKQDVTGDFEKAEKHARGVDGSSRPTVKLPVGNWVTARMGKYSRLSQS